MPWPNLRYYPGICLGTLREVTKKISDDSLLRARIRTQDLLDKKQKF